MTNSHETGGGSARAGIGVALAFSAALAIGAGGLGSTANAAVVTYQYKEQVCPLGVCQTVATAYLKLDNVVTGATPSADFVSFAYHASWADVVVTPDGSNQDVDFNYHGVDPHFDYTQTNEAAGYSFTGLDNLINGVAAGGAPGSVAFEFNDFSKNYIFDFVTVPNSTTLSTFDVTIRVGGKPAGRGGSISRNGVTATNAWQATVPEPASWAMLLIGTGAIGASLRRRRGALPAS